MTNSREILLSIAIPTYNRAIILENTLDHIFSEIDKYELNEVVEVVISDNNSGDRTFDIVEKYILVNRFKIVYRKNEINLGVIRNIIKLIPLCSGRFWMFYGDDDMPPKGSLPKLIELFQNNMDVPVFMFKQHEVASIDFKNYDSNIFLTITQLASSYFYYIGNAGVFAIRHDLALQAANLYPNELLNTCWPQTNVLFLASSLSNSKTPILASTIVSFYSEHGNLIYYNSYYLFETLLYSLLRSAISIDGIIKNQFVIEARKSIYAIDFFETYKVKLIEQYMFYDYDYEKKQFEKTLKEAMISIPIEYRTEIAILKDLISKPSWYIKSWLYLKYFKKTKSLTIQTSILNKIKILSPLGFMAIIRDERKFKYDYYKEKGKGVGESSGYF
jgi:glycosyltransferase involved in cell wall biosynthesis